jgi:hypothetical protein
MTVRPPELLDILFSIDTKYLNKVLTPRVKHGGSLPRISALHSPTRDVHSPPTRNVLRSIMKFSCKSPPTRLRVSINHTCKSTRDVLSSNQIRASIMDIVEVEIVATIGPNIIPDIF